MRLLQDLVIESAKRAPQALAISAPDGKLTYGELDRQANQAARLLQELGVGPGDRVAIWAEKSSKVLVTMQAVLRLGAAYVPIDPQTPVTRAQAIIKDCDVKALFTTRRRAEEILRGDLADIPCLCIEGTWQGFGWDSLRMFSNEEIDDVVLPNQDGLAYILYTSGSTGTPKGVCLSHRNALAFIDWSVQVTRSSPNDRFANHAPFHFDLSVLDIYAAFSVDASVHLVPEGVSFFASRLVEFIETEQITIWYSVPSVLILMLEHGNFLEQQHIPIRTLIFAGEPFPTKYLRKIRNRWPSMKLFNFYGPTETNVCTYFEVKDIPELRTTPVPIGVASCGDRVWAEKADGSVAAFPGEEGELVVSGPTVMLGYWGEPPQGAAPYRTGDIVRIEDTGNFVYIGRRDQMVKIQGYRIELGDVEAALLDFPGIQEVSVVVQGSGMNAALVAFVVMANGSAKPSLLDLKRHCFKRLPRYMIVDHVRFISATPKTSTGKVDKKTLAGIASADTDKTNKAG